MARRYYDTAPRVYKLLKDHPALSQMISEFDIDEIGIKEVANFLVNNHEKISKLDLREIYNWGSYQTLEPDQPSPLAIPIDTIDQLPEEGDRIYYVLSEDKYYKHSNNQWVVDVNYKTYSSGEYQKYQEETGHLVWEEEKGFFIFIEDHDDYRWEELSDYEGDVSGSVIRKRDLPQIGIEPGDIYEVKGEDLLDIIATIYGFEAPDYHPPWSAYVSERGTNLLELLKFTIFYYRFGVTDNFYEKHIFDFIPEYDRDYILKKPKMKLFLEGIGRNLDNLEDRVSRIPDLYNIDETPDELLDYLGQTLGYEREDFTLANLSFRELLKNIIEIYKIKGTNYSFSFFFKFLGFNVNLKEFYFNKNVKNPESFPGIDETKVEYYLTTTNPLFETKFGYPAKYLNKTRNLDDWQIEYDALVENGCDNPIQYMMGEETFNNTNRWHRNPWTYFKTNLIEYQLNPFLNKVNLTASDNQTIRKYIKFLSPTYLFTWVNINLQPWVESYDVYTEIDEKLNIELEKTMGDFIDEETGDIYIYDNNTDYLEKIKNGRFKFRDHEKMDEYLAIYEGGETITFSIENYLNIGGDDAIGTRLRRDGIHIRKPGHPNYIDNSFHDGGIKLNFDNLNIYIKDHDTQDYHYSVVNVSDLPINENIGTIAYVESEDTYYILKERNDSFKQITPNDSTVVSESFPSYLRMISRNDLIDGNVYFVLDNGTYYRFERVDPKWFKADIIERFNLWNDYSATPFPAVPNAIYPGNGVTLTTNNPDIKWTEVSKQTGFNLQVSDSRAFENLVEDGYFDPNTTETSLTGLKNNSYYWRMRTKNSFGYWGEWSNIYYFLVQALPFPFDGEDIIEKTIYVNTTENIAGEIESVDFDILWEPQYNVQNYEVEVSLTEDFSTPAVRGVVAINRFSTSLLNNRTYYWRVRTRKLNEWQEWGETRSFSIHI